MIRDYTIGGYVRIASKWGGRESIGRVKHMTKTTVTLENGQKYSINGRPWGSSSERWGGGGIYAITDEEHKAMLKKNKAYDLQKAIENLAVFIDRHPITKNYGASEVRKKMMDELEQTKN